MKVVFIKVHIEHSKGDIIDMDEARANYLIKMGVCEAYQEPEKKEVTISTEKVERNKNHKPKKESK